MAPEGIHRRTIGEGVGFPLWFHNLTTASLWHLGASLLEKLTHPGKAGWVFFYSFRNLCSHRANLERGWEERGRGRERRNHADPDGCVCALTGEQSGEDLVVTALRMPGLILFVSDVWRITGFTKRSLPSLRALVKIAESSNYLPELHQRSNKWLNKSGTWEPSNSIANLYVLRGWRDESKVIVKEMATELSMHSSY